MAFCIKCGQSLNDSDVFCPNCGWRIEQKSNSISQNNGNNSVNFDNTFHNNNFNKADILSQNKGINIIGLFASIVIAVGSFMPVYYDRSGFQFRSDNFYSYAEFKWIILILAVVTALAIIMNNDVLALISGIFSSGLCFLEVINYHSYLSKLQQLSPKANEYLNKQMGYFINWCDSAYSFFNIQKNKNLV